ncbi:hypothetical protein llap_5257 [Limosa lapponica baueri]|uniref:Rna-directed dna polymerase from mobile element jockey-like n=1 Tax=Limosa lapponica baueri TaxID=1758121 RepID=A0A2I0UEG5_LIMLA|nr:hypothetical protein llap_5257 [Limosa lapponica baueri]
MKLKGSLGCSDHELGEFKIPRALRRAYSKLTALDFRRKDFGLFRDLLGKLPWDKALEGRGAQEILYDIQRELDKVNRWACANLMKVNKAKCKILHLGQGNPKHRYRLCREWMESSSEEKDLGVLVDEKLSVTQQCVLAAQKANHILDCIKRSTTSRLREVIASSALVRPYQEYCFQLSPQHKKDMDMLK